MLKLKDQKEKKNPDIEKLQRNFQLYELFNKKFVQENLVDTK